MRTLLHSSSQRSLAAKRLALKHRENQSMSSKAALLNDLG
jgi:hypothetical protein